MTPAQSLPYLLALAARSSLLPSAEVASWADLWQKAVLSPNSGAELAAWAEGLRAWAQTWFDMWDYRAPGSWPAIPLAPNGTAYELGTHPEEWPFASVLAALLESIEQTGPALPEAVSYYAQGAMANGQPGQLAAVLEAVTRLLGLSVPVVTGDLLEEPCEVCGDRA